MGEAFWVRAFYQGLDWRRLEANLNGIWIGAYKIRVNLARFSRNGSRKNDVEGNGIGMKNHIPRQINDRRSYADAVKGKRGEKDGNSVEGTKKNECIVLCPSKEALDKLEFSLLGELKSFDALKSIGDMNRLEGWPEVRYCYLGGLTV